MFTIIKEQFRESTIGLKAALLAAISIFNYQMPSREPPGYTIHRLWPIVMASGTPLVPVAVALSRRMVGTGTAVPSVLVEVLLLTLSRLATVTLYRSAARVAA